MYCGKCGTEIKKGTLKCQNCGAELDPMQLFHSPSEEVSSNTAEINRSAEEPIRTEAPRAPREVRETAKEVHETAKERPIYNTPSTEEMAESSVAAGKKNSRKAVMAVALAVVVLLLGAMLFNALKPKTCHYCGYKIEGKPLKAHGFYYCDYYCYECERMGF